MDVKMPGLFGRERCLKVLCNDSNIVKQPKQCEVSSQPQNVTPNMKASASSQNVKKEEKTIVVLVGRNNKNEPVKQVVKNKERNTTLLTLVGDKKKTERQVYEPVNRVANLAPMPMSYPITQPLPPPLRGFAQGNQINQPMENPVVYEPVASVALPPMPISYLVTQPPPPLRGFVPANQINPVVDKRVSCVANATPMPKHSSQMAQAPQVAGSVIPGYWDKFYIKRGAGYRRKDLLRALTTAVTPILITPVKFRREGKNVTFLLRDSFSVIEQLNKRKFKIRVLRSGRVDDERRELDVEVTVRHTRVQDLSIDPMEVVKTAVLKRLDRKMKSLNLSSFMDDEELSSTVLYPLWPLNAMHAILKMIEPHWKAIEIMNLANNNLRHLGYLASLPNLRILNVSDNDLANVSALNPLDGLPISDLTLDGNPLCSTFTDEKTYISAVKEKAPVLRKLDGVYIPLRPDIPCWRPNYIPPDHQTECTALVDQFLQHFFTLLDGGDRTRLRGMYHPSAYFSLTYVEKKVKGQKISIRLGPYCSESRNLRQVSDSSKRQQLLSQGAEEVLFTLCRLPATEHDPYSFAVDVPYYSNDAAMVVVHGVFREPSSIKKVFAFSRLFILKKVEENEYQIANEMLSIRKASPRQIAETFLHPKPKVPVAELSFNPAQDLSEDDRRQMTKIFSRITEMNLEWAAMVLEEAEWDIKKALQVFSELLKINKLPPEALLPEGHRTENESACEVESEK